MIFWPLIFGAMRTLPTIKESLICSTKKTNQFLSAKKKRKKKSWCFFFFFFLTGVPSLTKSSNDFFKLENLPWNSFILSPLFSRFASFSIDAGKTSFVSSLLSFTLHISYQDFLPFRIVNMRVKCDHHLLFCCNAGRMTLRHGTSDNT